MKAAGLQAIDTVIESTAVLVKSRKTTNPLVDLIVSRIRGVISTYLSRFQYCRHHPWLILAASLAAQKYVLCQYNVPRSLLSEASKVTPGKRAPTVTTLEENGWVAVSSMVEQKKIATVMDELTSVGATDILVLAIANSRTG